MNHYDTFRLALLAVLATALLAVGTTTALAVEGSGSGSASLIEVTDHRIGIGSIDTAVSDALAGFAAGQSEGSGSAEVPLPGGSNGLATSQSEGSGVP